MNEHLHDIHPDSNEGWQQMQFLLERHLPVKTNSLARKIFFINSTAAILFSMLLCTSLKFGNDLAKEVAFNSNMPTAVNISSSNLPASASYNNNKKIYLLDADKKGYSVVDLNAGNTTSPLMDGKSFIAIDDIAGSNDKINNGIIEKALAQKLRADRILIFSNNEQLEKQLVAIKKITPRKLSLYAGIGANIAINNGNNFQPYPFAEARYNVSDKFYLAGGLTAWSPVSTTVSGISKTVFLNDIINNIRLYNEISTYSRLKYADLSISAGLNITKHLSVQTGLQSSVLMNKKIEKRLAPYDYQLNSLSPTTLPIRTTAAPEQDFNVQARDNDWRIIGAIRYTQNKTVIGLSYQHALQPAGKGDNVKRNNLVSLTVAFKVR